jgi:hypothetical protein
MIAVAVPAATAKAKTAKAMSFFMVLFMGSAVGAPGEGVRRMNSHRHGRCTSPRSANSCQTRMIFSMLLSHGSAIAAAVRVCRQGQSYPN